MNMKGLDVGGCRIGVKNFVMQRPNGDPDANVQGFVPARRRPSFSAYV
jgi:hypothetical protein